MLARALKAVATGTAGAAKLAPVVSARCGKGAPALASISLLRCVSNTSRVQADAVKEQPRHADPATESKYGWALNMLGYYTDESKVIRYSRVLYENVKKQSETPYFVTKCGVEEELRHVLAMTGLHLWMVLVRLRREGEYGKDLGQGLYDVFWEDMTKVVKDAGVKGRILTDQLSRLQEAFYGAWHAFDEGLESSDPVLAVALWRNIYERRDDVSLVELERMTQYVRMQVAFLDQLNSDAVNTGVILWQDVKKMAV
eukprot:CAMPEP_0113888030 /NCGR_PEP_ID=MMETSP0780_2-20120614/12601_1 /TAXON_ID=652834 /ORGANISM="Palpitomonas bilix" /LENGTH=255 /DNA_ID=CAMNT_0000876745 /DNA_START=30 /DNA_END=797 /DNA_ORIENTATION=+ /assembly_acc=CAM_ASM_000599